MVDYEKAFNALMLDCGLVCVLDDAVEAAAFRNREDVERARMCRCFSCEAAVDPAEVRDWADGGETAICPECRVDMVVPDKGWEDGRAGAPVVPCAAPSEVRWASHLALGMVEHPEWERSPDLVRYVDWAEEQGLVQFSSQERAGVIHALTDVDGTDCVAVDVGLRVDGSELGSLTFELRPFPGQSRGKVVDLAARRRGR